MDTVVYIQRGAGVGWPHATRAAGAPSTRVRSCVNAQADSISAKPRDLNGG